MRRKSNFNKRKKNETKKVATGEKKVATTTAKKLQLLEKKGGAPKGNKNHLKHRIYEKILFEFLVRFIKLS